MRRLFVVCGVLSLLLLAAPTGGTLSPVNICVAKTKRTTCKSGVQNGHPPGSNPQKQTKTKPVGGTAKFFYKLKNPNPGDTEVYILADSGDANFAVTYTIAGADVTKDLTSCTFHIVPKKNKIWIVQTIHDIGGLPGTSPFYGVGTFDSGCSGAHDLAFARVRLR